MAKKRATLSRKAAKEGKSLNKKNGSKVFRKGGLMNISMKMIPLILVGAFLLSPAWGAEKQEVFKATADKSGVQKIEMTAGEYYFKPNHVVVRVGKPVELVISREPGFASHSIVLQAPGAGVDINVNLETEAKTITFTPTKAGKYPFYCDKGLVEKHRGKGMEGVLEVTE
jgi:plastocyanin